MSLCQQCRTISTTVVRVDAEEDTEVYTHTAETFHQAVVEGCCFCTRLGVNDSLSDDGYTRATMKEAEFPNVSCSLYNFQNTYKVQFLITGPHFTSPSRWKFFRLYDVFDFGFSEFGKRTDHPNTWARIKHWHKICKETHPLCNGEQPALNQGHPDKWLPTRLLHIQLPGGDNNRARIINTADLTTEERPKASYLTLSHCWGRHPFLRLTQDNKVELFNSLPMDHKDLPPNFRDAIHATRKLGFQYIWIDSLCIIQGKDGDWDAEAPLMDKVFMNAELCLAAAASLDVMGGLFRDRDLTALSPFKIELSLSGPATFAKEELLQQRRPFYVYGGGEYCEDKWHRLIDKCPLNTRGWVQQERVLAPRTIHFAADQVCWDRRELQACETVPDNDMGKCGKTMVKNWETTGPEAIADWRKSQKGFLDNKRRKNNRKEITMEAAQSVLKPPARYAYKAWRRIIKLYTSCQLSHESDKLVAASGLAKAFARHLGQEGMETEYLAGLSRGYLVEELLWYRTNDLQPNQTRTQRLKEYRAPSWSWASLDGPIEWLPEDYEDVARVTSTRVDPLDACVGAVSDPTSRVKYGEVTLQTYLVNRTRVPAALSVKLILDVEGEVIRVSEDRLLLAPLCVEYPDSFKVKVYIGLILEEVGKDDERQKFKRLGLFKLFQWLENNHGRPVNKQWYGEKDKRDVTIVLRKMLATLGY